MNDLADFFARLRAIRVAARVSQQQMALALGLHKTYGRTTIYRLETGRIPNPTLGLIIGYLRVCGAGINDISGELSRLLAEPIPVPRAVRAGHRLPPPYKETDEDRALRKSAARGRLRSALEVLLHDELNRLGIPPFTRQRDIAARFGRRLISVLRRGHSAKPQTRDRDIARVGQWAKEQGIAAASIEPLTRAIGEGVEAMRQSGELDLMPTLAEARAWMTLPTRRRVVTDKSLCGADTRSSFTKNHALHLDELHAHKAAARELLQAAGAPADAIGVYETFINGFIHIAKTTGPGSPERAAQVEARIRQFGTPRTEPELLRRLADLIFTRVAAAAAAG